MENKNYLNEEWRTIPSWDLYEVSNYGRIKSKERIVRQKNPYKRKEKLLHPSKDKYGYYVISLYKNGNRKFFKVHRLVAICFIPNPDNKPCVNHIDNNPSNCHVNNLEWVTMQENTDWMIKQGRFVRTEKWLENLHKSQEVTYKSVIGTNIETGEILHFQNINSVRKFGFQPSSVCNCCKGKRKKHKGFYWEYEKHNAK